MTDGWDISPPFNAEASLQTLKRYLRDQRVLVERADAWQLAGQPVLKLAIEAGALQLQLARRPARTPEWERLVLASVVDVRRAQDEIRRRLARWQDDD